MSSVSMSAVGGAFVSTCLGEFYAFHFVCTLEPACWLAYTPEYPLICDSLGIICDYSWSRLRSIPGSCQSHVRWNEPVARAKRMMIMHENGLSSDFCLLTDGNQMLPSVRSRESTRDHTIMKNYKITIRVRLQPFTNVDPNKSIGLMRLSMSPCVPEGIYECSGEQQITVLFGSLWSIRTGIF